MHACMHARAPELGARDQFIGGRHVEGRSRGFVLKKRLGSSYKRIYVQTLLFHSFLLIFNVRAELNFRKNDLKKKCSP